MSTKTIYGLYGDDEDLLKAVKKIRSEDFEIKEVFTPFPVHHLDKALGLKYTRLPYMAFLYACYGVSLAALLTWYMMIFDWPQDIGGKPSFSWGENMPAFVPIMFELTVFCAAHMMSLTFLIRNKLFPGAEPQNPDPRTTDDKFLIEMEVSEGQIEKVKELMVETGVEEITMPKDKPASQDNTESDVEPTPASA